MRIRKPVLIKRIEQIKQQIRIARRDREDGYRSYFLERIQRADAEIKHLLYRSVNGV